MSLIKQYEKTVIIRQGLMFMLMGPSAAAVVKLQGSILDEAMIMGIMLITSAYGMTSYIVAKNFKWETIFKVSLAGNLLAVICFTVGYMMGLTNMVLLVGFPILNQFFILLAGIYSSKVKNVLKDVVGEGFDIGMFENKKHSVACAAGLIGQALAMMVFYFWDMDLMLFVLCIEIIKTVYFYVTEIRIYKIVNTLQK